MGSVLKFVVVIGVAFSFAGCEGRKENLAQLKVELEELHERKQGAIVSCKMMHMTQYQEWREKNAERLPPMDHLAKAICFEEEKDQDWVKAWKATEEQIVEWDSRIKSIEALLGDSKSAD